MNKQVEQIRAEIERQAEKYQDTYTDMMRDALLSFIDSLPEKPSKDLGADIEMEWDSFNKHLTDYGDESDEVVWLNWNSFNDVARHFYELGQASVRMPEERPSKSLEEAAMRYAIPAYMKDVDENYLYEYPRDPIKEEAFQAGAQWQAEHTEDYPMPEDTVLFQKGVAEGRRLEREDVMKDLPKWKKNTGALRYGILEDEHGRYIQHDGYKLYFDDLLKLPKED